MLDVTRLRVLAAVARHGSVTAAARALGYAQPSVSHHLARLEAETGSRLVQRVGRGVRLTDAGRMLAERAEEILGRLESAEDELAAHAGLHAGRVRLAAFPSALGTFVPRAAAAFAAAHPDVELRFTEAEPPDAARLLRSGEVDIALLFSYSGAPPADDGLRRTPLLTEPIYLVTPAGLPGDRIGDHAARRWITGCERCRTHLVRCCEAAGFTPDIAFTTDDYVAVQALVAAGLGVTALPGLALAAQLNPAVRPVRLPGHERVVSAAVHGEPPDPPGVAALLGHLARATATALTPL
ncbi:LysR family transcriptional regulator [Streptomyces spongiicola]|uniref:LysR family transcriptional regulator n=1 Tax=Streptomyces spongiicola TaxID=1690221 RepID=A0A2S1Z5T8_9ACTN|nr:LysR family transcriptional regulator [Streptomyces spongiicola]AWK11717.1 LysR family transcriptional regulator [Streptomyces spongiicola]GBP98740.1 LysR family transcriptional regulator [Streptomyces spongiicola]